LDASKNRDGPELGLVCSRTAGVLEMEACSKGSLGYASRRGLGGWSVQPLPLCTSAHLLFLFQKRSNGAQCSLQISLVANSSLAGNGDLFQVGPNERDESVQGGLFKRQVAESNDPFWRDRRRHHYGIRCQACSRLCGRCTSEEQTAASWDMC